jgi:AcrR family transcriptional regulator
LFARHGLYSVTVREITQAADQRNVSAINYHFGSREGVLDAILRQHGDPTDEERAKYLATLGHDPSPRELMAALVVPYGAHLRTADGRDYLRIVAQMSGQFPEWYRPRPGTGPVLIDILTQLQRHPADLPEAIRNERIIASIQLMTSAMAERARAIEDGLPVGLDEPTFLANLTDVLVGILEAPLRGPLP